jgi:hypothetical protein
MRSDCRMETGRFSGCSASQLFVKSFSTGREV